jgi:hypothetical protein
MLSDAPRLVVGEQMRSRSPPRLLHEIDSLFEVDERQRQQDD